MNFSWRTGRKPGTGAGAGNNITRPVVVSPLPPPLGARVDSGSQYQVSLYNRGIDDDDLKKLLEANAETSRSQFEDTAERMEKLFDTLAEAVGRLNERLTSESIGIKKEVSEGFYQTRVMIKFSHSDLNETTS